MNSVRSKTAAAVAAISLTAAVLLSSCAPGAAASVAALAAPTAATTAAQEPVSAARTITVVGRGEVRVSPDVARSNIGVEAVAPTVADAMSDAQARMAAVIAALKEIGVAANDIQTSNFSINFERQMPERVVPSSSAEGTASQAQNGVYHVSNMVEVTIRDLDSVGDVIDAAVEAGANNIWGVSFGLDEKEGLEAEAREKAVADARARAESLASLHGVSLGTIVAVSEVVGNVPGPVFADAASGKGFGGGTPVEPGEVTFTTQIQVVYAIQ